MGNLIHHLVGQLVIFQAVTLWLLLRYMGIDDMFRTVVVAIFFSMLGAALPDIDHPMSKLHRFVFRIKALKPKMRHRGFWHTPWMGFIYIGVVYWLTDWLGLGNWVIVCAATGWGFFSHLLIDWYFDKLHKDVVKVLSALFFLPKKRDKKVEEKSVKK